MQCTAPEFKREAFRSRIWYKYLFRHLYSQAVLHRVTKCQPHILKDRRLAQYWGQMRSRLLLYQVLNVPLLQENRGDANSRLQSLQIRRRDAVPQRQITLDEVGALNKK